MTDTPKIGRIGYSLKGGLDRVTFQDFDSLELDLANDAVDFKLGPVRGRTVLAISQLAFLEIRFAGRRAVLIQQ